MTISKRCIETLIDLTENKLSCMEVTDAEDRRERELLERCITELKAEAAGVNASLLAMPAPKRRGRRPKHLQYHELHVA